MFVWDLFASSFSSPHLAYPFTIEIQWPQAIIFPLRKSMNFVDTTLAWIYPEVVATTTSKGNKDHSWHRSTCFEVKNKIIYRSGIFGRFSIKVYRSLPTIFHSQDIRYKIHKEYSFLSLASPTLKTTWSTLGTHGCCNLWWRLQLFAGRGRKIMSYDNQRYMTERKKVDSTFNHSFFS